MDTPEASTGRNLLLFFDGTNNQFGIENTSIVRLIQVLDRDSAKQLVFYDPGVGTLPEPWITTWVGKKLADIAGLASGAGLFGKISDAYIFLMEHYRPGDRVSYSDSAAARIPRVRSPRSCICSASCRAALRVSSPT